MEEIKVLCCSVSNKFPTKVDELEIVNSIGFRRQEETSVLMNYGYQRTATLNTNALKVKTSGGKIVLHFILRVETT